jgi:hypothetical protein
MEHSQTGNRIASVELYMIGAYYKYLISQVYEILPTTTCFSKKNTILSKWLYSNIGSLLFFEVVFYLETNISLMFNIVSIWKNTTSHLEKFCSK